MMVEKYAFLYETLQLPSCEFKFKEAEDGKLCIFDSLRKKYLILTPEEWVRQHIVQMLIHHYQYPKSLFSLERGVKYNHMKKRFDVLILDRKGNPFFLIECKAPDIVLSQNTIEQVCLYNKSIEAPHMGISNGKQHILMQFDAREAKYVQTFTWPAFVY